MNTQEVEQKLRSKALLVWMIVSQILGVLLVLPGLAFGLFGFLLEGTLSFNFFMLYVSPVLMLIPMFAAWLPYSKRNDRLAGLLTSIPILYVCIDGAIILMMFLV